MEECLRIRNTEAEELMKQREEHYEQQLQGARYGSPQLE